MNANYQTNIAGRQDEMFGMMHRVNEMRGEYEFFTKMCCKEYWNMGKTEVDAIRSCAGCPGSKIR